MVVDGGTLVLDDRAAPTQPGTCFLAQEWAQAVAVEQARLRLPVQDVEVIGRNGGGAVYRATWEGRQVVLKEAVRLRGWSPAGDDASLRLRHEYAVLQRLRGRGLTPEPLDYLRCGDSEFIVMEYVDGASLTAEILRRHPTALSDDPPMPVPEYLAWSEKTGAELRRLVAGIHSAGVVHHDLHPHNILALPDGSLRAIDLECASLDGSRVTAGGGTVGFCPVASGAARDEMAVSRMETMMRNPMVGVLDRNPHLAGVIEAAGHDDMTFYTTGELPATRTPAADAERASADALLRGILQSGTPGRRDRLYPGSTCQFSARGGALGLWSGAAGVHAVLQLSGVSIPDDHRRWLGDRALAEPDNRGLAHGADGLAHALAVTGQHDLAAVLLERIRRRGAPVKGPSWGFGHAGCALAWASCADELGDATLLDEAYAHVCAALDAVESPHAWQAPVPGLVHGPAGTAMALLRLRAEGWTTPLHERLDAAVLRCVDLELGMSCTTRGRLLGRSARGRLPYLDGGSAAITVVLHHAERLGLPLDDSARAARHSGLKALRAPNVGSAGLGNGRAGLMLALARLAPGDPIMTVHRDRLAWHVAPSSDGQVEALTLGEENVRLSADVATGSAGLVVALAGPPLASRLLGFPPCHDSVPDMLLATHGACVASR